ncbi:hypothetical protein P3T76_004671 [Phytophthora citrophthora]|uniref:CCHC-type domain-containing protein n=1 Tax=Phytophthora citrophthora TaxID=4793 RepID=A0AAD9GRK0_9STRA|nr:hypothetical protein P3T76_004671 [Phytophthora citrophthora]
MSGEQRKKDPPMYEGKYGEDIELWIFATEQYYASRRELMEADTSDFVTMISSNLGKSVLNWYRAFIAECEGTNVQPTWSLFKGRLRTRFRPKDFEYDLRNGLREETARKIKEESPSTLQDAIEIASNFEFAHYSGKPPRAPAKGSQGSSSSGHRASKSKQNSKSSDKKKGKSDDWKKTATCRNCGKFGHISPDCTQPKRTEANRYMQGAVYAILEAEAQAFKTDDQKRPVTIFIDNGSSLNGVTEELVKKLELDVTEGDMMQVDLGYDQVVHRPRRTVEMSLQLPGFPLTTGTFQVMPVPEGKDIVLGMMWLREQNPDIDWNTGQIAPRIKVENTQTVKLRLPKTRPARWVAGQRRARVAQGPWPQRPVWANEDYFVQTVPADVA